MISLFLFFFFKRRAPSSGYVCFEGRGNRWNTPKWQAKFSGLGDALSALYVSGLERDVVLFPSSNGEGDYGFSGCWARERHSMASVNISVRNDDGYSWPNCFPKHCTPLAFCERHAFYLDIVIRDCRSCCDSPSHVCGVVSAVPCSRISEISFPSILVPILLQLLESNVHEGHRTFIFISLRLLLPFFFTTSAKLRFLLNLLLLNLI